MSTLHSADNGYTVAELEAVRDQTMSDFNGVSAFYVYRYTASQTRYGSL
jgi:hypothetical protein